MTSQSRNILITGLPGSGKTTLIKKLADELREYSPAGFYTEEIRSHGIRKGFRLATLDGKKTGTLAHVDIKGTHHVGKYGVDLQGFEQFLEAAHLSDPHQRLVIIDEIGRMECMSAKFRAMATSLMDSPAPVIATIALKAGGFIDKVKHRPDVQIFRITERNRDTLPQDIAGLVCSLF